MEFTIIQRHRRSKRTLMRTVDWKQHRKVTLKKCNNKIKYSKLLKILMNLNNLSCSMEMTKSTFCWVRLFNSKRISIKNNRLKNYCIKRSINLNKKINKCCERKPSWKNNCWKETTQF